MRACSSDNGAARQSSAPTSRLHSKLFSSMAYDLSVSFRALVNRRMALASPPFAGMRIVRGNSRFAFRSMARKPCVRSRSVSVGGG